MATMIAPGATHSMPIMGSRNPPSPSSSWDQTMHDLSRQLQEICRSPTTRSVSPHGGPGLLVQQRSVEESPPSPFQVTPPSTSPCKPVNVRHSQSEEQFAKQLSRICLTPKPRRAISEGDKKSPSPQRQLFDSPQKRVFQETIDINGYTLENLNVLVDGSKLKVSAFTNNNSGPHEVIWTREIDIPTHVDPTSLTCIVKDGSLVIRSLSRGCGVPCAQIGQCDGDMIIIEDDGSEKLRILLPIPESCAPEDIQVRTVDDKLLVVGKPEVTAKWGNIFSKSFQLPQSVDPFSITALVNEKDQLLIEATLSQRQRCQSL